MRVDPPPGSSRAGVTEDEPTPRGGSRPEISPPAPSAGGAATEILDGRYELLHLLGTGGMGLVYAARHVVLDTRVAVKILRDGSDVDRVATERFRREARAASAIGHPGIVEVRDFGTTPDGRSYLVMEHVEGRDLATEIRGGGPLSPARAALVAARIAGALGAAHAHGIVHRDLKPENVLLVERLADDGLPEGSVKVLDFGIAKVAGTVELAGTPQSELGSRITAFGQLLGTPEYMAPEQCTSGTIGPEADVYALGVMLFEMTTGELPFDAESPLDLVRLHAEVTPRSPADLDPSLPPALVAIVERCLEKRPEDRFRTMRELEAALLEVAVPRDAFPGSETPTLPPTAPRRPLRVALVAAGIALAAGSVVALARSLGAGAPPGEGASGAAIEASAIRTADVTVVASPPAAVMRAPEPSDEHAREQPAPVGATSTAAEPRVASEESTDEVGAPAASRPRLDGAPREAWDERPARRAARRASDGHSDDPPTRAARERAREPARQAPRRRILDEFIDPWADPS